MARPQIIERIRRTNIGRKPDATGAADEEGSITAKATEAP
jgi:hypothetical protein